MVRGAAGRWSVLRLGLVLLEAPWWMAWLVYTSVMLMLRAMSGLNAVKRAARDSLPCPAGHDSALVGRWECRCGYVFVGHAFEPCGSCGEVAGWITCERCGLGVRARVGRR